jgi:hypothetical protein
MNRDFLSKELSALALRKEVMISYLKLKLEEQDWHGVQDAASDLRDIESERTGIIKALGAVND